MDKNHHASLSGWLSLKLFLSFYAARQQGAIEQDLPVCKLRAQWGKKPAVRGQGSHLRHTSALVQFTPCMQVPDADACLRAVCMPSCESSSAMRASCQSMCSRVSCSVASANTLHRASRGQGMIWL